MRLAVVGGSSVSTPGLALALREYARARPLEVALHGRSPEKLAVVARASGAALRDLAKVSHTVDLDEALDGADLVLIQVRPGGLQGRGFDERFPRELGLVGEETLGAGGFANAVRSVPIVLELTREIVARAPAARIVNLTNPASLVQQAVARYAGATVLSVCDVPVTLEAWVHRLLGASSGELRVEYYGTNHIGWITSAVDLATGTDRLPEAIDRLDELDDYPLPAAWARALGVLPGPYLRYFYDRDRYAAAPNGRTRADDLLELESAMLGAYDALAPGASASDVEAVVARRAPHWYGEIVVPVLEALSGDEPRRLVVQIPNEGRDPRLPPHQTIEVAAAVSAGGVDAESLPTLPPDCRALLDQNAAYEQLAVESIVEGDRDKARRALALLPLVGTMSKADAVLAAAWPS